MTALIISLTALILLAIGTAVRFLSFVLDKSNAAPYVEPETRQIVSQQTKSAFPIETEELIALNTTYFYVKDNSINQFRLDTSSNSIFYCPAGKSYYRFVKAEFGVALAKIMEGTIHDPNNLHSAHLIPVPKETLYLDEAEAKTELANRLIQQAGDLLNIH